MEDKSATEQIDDIIATYGGWKGQTLAWLRRVITKVSPDITEEIKWKMRTRPEGLPVWSVAGIVCYAETWKDNIKLIFAHGAQLEDSDGLFNARLNSSDIRAIEFKEGVRVDEKALASLVRQAVVLNQAKRT